MLLVPVSAIPTTGVATDIGTNNVTLHGTGITGSVGWFKFGMLSGQTWSSTRNVTAIAGSTTLTMRGTPLFGNTTYYYRACDVTGCGSEVSFTILPITPLPTTTFGIYVQAIIDSDFDLGATFWYFLMPYISVTTNTVFFAFIFGMIFVGIWLRTRGTIIATQIWMLFAGFACASAIGLQLGLPPELVQIAQALLYISLAGAFVSYTFR